MISAMDAGPSPTPLRAAFEERDHAALVEALADDVVVRSPIFDLPFTGIDEASDLFASVLEVLPPINYLAEIPGDPHVLYFRAEIDGTEVEGCDLLRFDERGKVKEMTIFLRPFPGIAAFLKGTAPTLGRKRGGAGRAFILKVAGAPVNFLMRRTAASGPSLLRLRSRKGSAG
jgi:SnoaL-like domain